MQPIDWSVENIRLVARNITTSQTANQGVYPYTAEQHPKYNPWFHNAIGNLFEIPNGASGYTLTNTHITLKDIYWELSEFVNDYGVPTIVLCFNNYGATFTT